jgi:hypothetical protein
MGRGTIVSALGDGLYRVAVDTGSEIKNARIEALTAEIEDIASIIPEYEATRREILDVINTTSSLLNSLISAYEVAKEDELGRFVPEVLKNSTKAQSDVADGVSAVQEKIANTKPKGKSSFTLRAEVLSTEADSAAEIADISQQTSQALLDGSYAIKDFVQAGGLVESEAVEQLLKLAVDAVDAADASFINSEKLRDLVLEERDNAASKGDAQATARLNLILSLCHQSVFAAEQAMLAAQAAYELVFDAVEQNRVVDFTLANSFVSFADVSAELSDVSLGKAQTALDAVVELASESDDFVAPGLKESKNLLKEADSAAELADVSLQVAQDILDKVYVLQQDVIQNGSISESGLIAMIEAAQAVVVSAQASMDAAQAQYEDLYKKWRVAVESGRTEDAVILKVLLDAADENAETADVALAQAIAYVEFLTKLQNNNTVIDAGTVARIVTETDKMTELADVHQQYAQVVRDNVFDLKSTLEGRYDF